MNLFEQSDATAGAQALWAYYAALVAQGFTPDQALSMLNTILAATLSK